jgi:hypothetical protein
MIVLFCSFNWIWKKEWMKLPFLSLLNIKELADASVTFMFGSGMIVSLSRILMAPLPSMLFREFYSLHRLTLLPQVWCAWSSASHDWQGLVTRRHRRPLQHGLPQWLQVCLLVCQGYWAIPHHPRLPTLSSTRRAQLARWSSAPVA